MSTRQVGNARENRVSAVLEKLGWYCYPSRGSRGIDVIAIAEPEYRANGGTTRPHLGLEIGGLGKSHSAAFAKMRSAPQCPGMILLVVKETKANGKRRLRWYASERGKHGGHESVQEAIVEARTL
jgi:hypothetical protein